MYATLKNFVLIIHIDEVIISVVSVISDMYRSHWLYVHLSWEKNINRDKKQTNTPVLKQICKQTMLSC